MNDRRLASEVARLLLRKTSERDDQYRKALADINSACYSLNFDLDGELRLLRSEICSDDQRLKDLTTAVWFAIVTIPTLRESLREALDRHGFLSDDGDIATLLITCVCIAATVVVIFTLIF